MAALVITPAVKYVKLITHAFLNLSKFFSVGFNHLLIPVKGIFSAPGKSAASVLLLIHIDKTVSFLHLPAAGAD